MKQEIRMVVRDDELSLEACCFAGIMQPFPVHFHEYYVIGLMEDGARTLSCKNQEYSIRKGDVLVFHPGDSHGCVQHGGTLSYRSLNIPKEVMAQLAEDITGRRELPCFSQNVIALDAAAHCLRTFHEQLLTGSCALDRKESLLLLTALLIQNYGQPLPAGAPKCRREVERACTFLEEHCAEHICLDQLCRFVSLSKSTLLRAFVREKGVTPYRYLETVRISRARQLLDQGTSPTETALQTGFSDQSHFTNCFRRFMGLAPGLYRQGIRSKTTCAFVAGTQPAQRVERQHL